MIVHNQEMIVAREQLEQSWGHVDLYFVQHEEWTSIG